MVGWVEELSKNDKKQRENSWTCELMYGDGEGEGGGIGGRSHRKDK